MLFRVVEPRGIRIQKSSVLGGEAQVDPYQFSRLSLASSASFSSTSSTNSPEAGQSKLSYDRSLHSLTILNLIGLNHRAPSAREQILITATEEGKK